MYRVYSGEPELPGSLANVKLLERSFNQGYKMGMYLRCVLPQYDNWPYDLQLYLKETSTQVFFCEY